MSAPPPIDAVFFDLGGTLFRYGGRQGGGIRWVLEEFQIAAPAEQIGSAWRDASSQAAERYSRQPYFLHRDLFRATLDHFLQSFGHRADEDFFEAFHLRQLQALVDHLPLREECRDTLQALRDRGLYLSVVSNIDDDYLFPLLEKHDLVALFDHCISSEAARSCKPDPDIFHFALGKAERHPHDVLFVGDSLHHDVAGAHRVGMRSARIVDEGVATPLTQGLEVVADPDYEITTLSDLLEIVDGVGRS
ncbi:MAG: HAD family hydrolase [Pseudomonadales bacterium]